MSEPSIILDNRKIDVRKMDGLYKAVVYGLTFTSETFQGLVNAIGSLYTISVIQDYVVPKISLIDSLKTILNSDPILVNRQKALARLELLSDSEAIRIVNSIKSKPVSPYAEYITKVLGKKHFSEITSIDISDLVANILLRSKLLSELSNIVRL